MGASHGEFTKYPRTPHLFGAKGTADDKRLGDAESQAFISDESLIVEEKLDGTNVGIHFSSDGSLILQCRGHLITDGMHPQYDLFKQWTAFKRGSLESRLEDRYLLFGEWLYAQHTVAYRALPHYFFEFDIYDKEDRVFLDLERRLALIHGLGIETVPVVHRGAIRRKDFQDLIGKSEFDSSFEHPRGVATDDRMEGVYLRTEASGVVTGRAKCVRPEFVEKIQESVHWQHTTMVPNELADGADIWS